MTKMKLEDIADAAHTMASQLAAGISAVASATLMIKVQPDFAQFWASAAKQMSTGQLLSESLKEVWPEQLVAIVNAGEQSGKTDAVLEQIGETMRLELAMKEEVGQLKQPLGILAVGMAVFTFMMLYVIPKFNEGMRTTGSKNHDGFTALSIAINAWITPIWLPLLVALGGSCFVLFNWLQTDEGKASLANYILTVPGFGPAVRDFHYSVWSRFMGTVHAAGIPLIDGLRLTRSGMPLRLREGIENFEYDLRVKQSSIESASSEQNWTDEDQRHEWPEYLRRAFIVGANTGSSEVQLISASTLIMQYAQRRLKKAVKRATVIAWTASGSMIGLSILALYLPILSSLKNLR
jgi:type IV pilus assembly protein PilC